MYMYDVKIKKIDALAQEYKLSNTQVELLKFYADPNHKYWNVFKALEEIGIEDTLEARMDIDWLLIWKFLRQPDDGYPVPIYLCV